MTLTQSRTLARIDHDRRACAAAIRGRLMRADKRGDDLAEAMKRLSFIAYLRGMRRTVLDASAAINQDVRAAHYNLSRADDDAKEERDRLLWLLAFLGLPWTAVELQRYRAEQVAVNAAGEIRSVAVKVAQRAQEQADDLHAKSVRLRGVKEGVRRDPSVRASESDHGSASRRTYEPSPRASGARQGGTATTAEGKSETVAYLKSRVSPDVFGRFGKSDVHLTAPQSAIDTWAEAVAYSQYERGRYDAANQFPAVSDALWGYRWSSVLDNRTTVGCRALDGWVAPIEDHWMKALAPPRHFNCRAALIPVWQSSRLRAPEPVPPRVSEATLNLYLAQKEDFIRRIA